MFKKLICKLRGHEFINIENYNIGVCHRCGKVMGSVEGYVAWKMEQAKCKLDEEMAKLFIDS